MQYTHLYINKDSFPYECSFHRAMTSANKAFKSVVKYSVLRGLTCQKVYPSLILQVHDKLGIYDPVRYMHCYYCRDKAYSGNCKWITNTTTW